MSKQRIQMGKLREILRLCLEQKISLRQASKASGVSKTTIGEYLSEFKRSGLSYSEVCQMSDSMLIEVFEGANLISNKEYEKLSQNFKYYEKELKRPGVTLSLLWGELQYPIQIYNFSPFFERPVIQTC